MADGLNELFSDKEKVRSFIAKSPEEMVKDYAEYGRELSLDEANELKDILIKLTSNSLTDEEKLF